MLHRVSVGLMLLLLANVQLAHADGARGIVFISGGQTTAEQDEFSGTATAVKFGSGFQATNSSSLEIYWTSYGEAKEKVAGADFRAEAFSLALLYGYHYPLGAGVDLLAKAGAVLWKTNYGFVGFPKDQDQGVDLIVAAGTEIDIGGDWAFRVEWEYSEFDQTDVSLISAGVISYFD